MRSKKTTAKRQTQNSILMLAEKVEKEFRQLPNRLAKLYRQEVTAQKAQESKLKKELQTVQAAQAAALKKETTLKKTATKSSKKQLAKLKKTLQKTQKTTKTLTMQLAKMASNSNMLLVKHYKYSALNKELASLEKQLSAKAHAKLNTKTKKATPKKTTAKTKMKTSPKKMDETVTEEAPFMVSPKTEPVEM